MIPMILLVVSVIGADPVSDKDAKKEELGRFEGVWKIVSGEGLEKDAKGKLVTFKEGKVSFDGSELKVFTIDPSKKPKWIDLEQAGPKDILPGICKLDGDKLTIYLTTEYLGKVGPQRPKHFDTSKVDAPAGQVINLERVKK